MAAQKPLRVFHLKGRRVIFYTNSAVLREHCNICYDGRRYDGQLCSFSNSIHRRSRTLIKRALDTAGPKARVVYIGCMRFRGPIVAYARRWARGGRS